MINHLSHFVSKRYISCKIVEGTDIKKDSLKEDSSSENLETRKEGQENSESNQESSQNSVNQPETRQEIPENIEIKKEIVEDQNGLSNNIVTKSNGSNGIFLSNNEVKLEPIDSQENIDISNSTNPVTNSFTYLNNGDSSSIQHCPTIQFMPNNIVTVTNSLIVAPQIPGNGQ